jgi:hypothetical protein
MWWEITSIKSCHSTLTYSIIHDHDKKMHRRFIYLAHTRLDIAYLMSVIQTIDALSKRISSESNFVQEEWCSSLALKAYTSVGYADDQLLVLRGILVMRRAISTMWWHDHTNIIRTEGSFPMTMWTTLAETEDYPRW